DPGATVTSIRLFDLLPEHPIVTVARATQLLGTSRPTAGNAVEALCAAGVLDEITGRQRGRVYAYRAYLGVLAEETGPVERP
ncbi:MAG: hypothetical protein AMK73_05495, partial [Planctomycetes bacterium SM23_32]